ncbi:hypothetical protein AB0G48_25180 [Streptomyces rubiginosohelvolus]
MLAQGRGCGRGAGAYREHAAATGMSRLDLEMAVKQSVRHSESEPAA